MKKSIISLIVILLILTLTSCQDKNGFKVLAVKNIYNIMENDFLISCYINDSTSPYIDIENISSSYLYDKLTNTKYEIKITKSTVIDKKLTYEQEDFFETIFSIHFPFTTNQMLKIPCAYLLIEYINDNTLTLNIGSLAYFSLTEEVLGNHLMIEQVSGIVNQVNERNTLKGIVLKIKNTQNEKINIDNISLINPFCIIDYDYICFLNSIPLTTANLSDLLSDDYYENHLLNKQSFSFIVSPNEEIIILLPLIYEYSSILNQSGIIIHYQYQNQSYQKMINNFKFFQDYQMSSQSEVSYVPN